MKNLIGILVLLFVTTGVFGQKFLRSTSEVERTEETIQRWNVIDGNYDWIDCIHFIQNDRLYLLSYEPNEIFTSGKKIPTGAGRDIYLYSKDINDINSPWEKASNIIMTNNWINGLNYNEVDFFIYNEKRHNSSVGSVIVEKNCIKIIIGFDSMSNGNILINEEPITITFVPAGNNKYIHGTSSSL